jgi:hypothetical protein
VRELQRKGMSMGRAIIEAERDIPNYRLPTKLLGSRYLMEQFANSALFSFARYHFGMINSYANMFKDLMSPKATIGDRVDAFGKVMTIGVLGMVIYPLLDQAVQSLTGNKDARMSRRGPLVIPSHIAGAANGTEDIMAPTRAALTIAPLASTLGTGLFNHDWRGKPIVEPGDVQRGVRGNLHSAARAAGSVAEYAARGLVAPYNMYATTAMKAGPQDKGVAGQVKAVGRTIRDQALDIKDVSPAAAGYEKGILKHIQKDLKQREKKPHGPFEQLIDKAFRP